MRAVAAAALLLLLLFVANHRGATASVDYVLIEDTYDGGRCGNCTTNGSIVNGTLALPSRVGFVVYGSRVLDRVEEVVIGVSLVARNTSVVAIWLSPVYSVSALPNLDVRYRMVGPGVSVLLDFRSMTMYISATNEPGVVYPSVLGAVDIGGHVRSGGGYVALYLSIVYSMVTNRTAFMEVLVGGNRVYSSDLVHGWIPFHEPRYVYIIGDGGTPASAYVDYLTIRFSRYSARRVTFEAIEVEPIVLPLSVTIWRHNSTHIVVSYTCYYVDSVDECEELEITLSQGGGAVYSARVSRRSLTEVFRGVAVFRDYVRVVNGTLVYRVCSKDMCSEGSIHIQADDPLRSKDNPYLSYLAVVIPFAVVVALAARTGGMKAVGIGLIGAGVSVLMLPWLLVVPQSVYAVSMVLLSLGIIVLAIYRD